MSKTDLVDVAVAINVLLENKTQQERDAIIFAVLIKRLRSYEPEEKLAAILAYMELLTAEREGLVGE
ncbi:MAG: hypothetical protein RLZZ74_3458 [Cyanobacteriota bacterium]|jgi:hypothetical protein